jgi:hypothetical protein
LSTKKCGCLFSSIHPTTQQEKNNSNMKEKDIKEKLDMLRQEEKKLQQSVRKKNNPGGVNAKDW